jgi:hypothetical protein
VITHALYNYTRDHSFVWDEISIPLTYDSDWKRAKTSLALSRKKLPWQPGRLMRKSNGSGKNIIFPKKLLNRLLTLRSRTTGSRWMCGT